MSAAMQLPVELLEGQALLPADEYLHQYIGERDFRDTELIEFSRQAKESGEIFTGAEIAQKYTASRARAARLSQRAEYAERDRLEAEAQIVADAVAFTSGIPSHVAFDRLHDFVDQISHRSGNSFHIAELRADLWLAAM